MQESGRARIRPPVRDSNFDAISRRHAGRCNRLHEESLFRAVGVLPTPHSGTLLPYRRSKWCSRSPAGEKGARLEKAGYGVEFANPHSIKHRTHFEFRVREFGWICLSVQRNPRTARGAGDRRRFPDSMHTSPKRVRESEQTASKRSAELREDDATAVS